MWSGLGLNWFGQALALAWLGWAWLGWLPGLRLAGLGCAGPAGAQMVLVGVWGVRLEAQGVAWLWFGWAWLGWAWLGGAGLREPSQS